jgi:uncharacterized coiled-coil DUF342 family protein
VLKPMTDQELVPFERGAPLMVKRYRELRFGWMELAAGGLSAAQTLHSARLEIEKLQKRVKDLELELRDSAQSLDALNAEADDLRDERDRLNSDIQGLKDEITELNTRDASR